MEKDTLKILDRRLKIDADSYKTKVSDLSRERSLVLNKINKIKNEFKNIKEKINKLRNDNRANYKLGCNITNDYLNDLDVKGEKFKKLKIELSLKQASYTTAIRNLKKIHIKQEKVVEKFNTLNEVDEIKDEDLNLEELSSLKQSFSDNDVQYINNSSKNEYIEQNYILSDNMNMNQNNLTQKVNKEVIVSNHKLSHDISDKIKEVQTWQNTFGKSLSFSYSLSNNKEIKVNIYNGFNNNYSITLIPSLLRDKLKIWHNSKQLTQAFNEAGIQIDSLKIIGGGKNV